MSSPGASPPVGSPPANNNTTPPPVAAPPPTSPLVPPPAAQVVPPPPVAAQPPSPPSTPASPPPANPTPNPTPPVSNPTPPVSNPTPPVPNPTPPTPSNPVPNPTPPSPTNPTPVNPTTPGTPAPPSRDNPSPPRSSGGGGGSASPNSDSGSSPSLSSGAIIGIAAAGALIVLTLVLVVCCLRRKPKRKYRRDEEYESGQYKAEMYEAGRRPRPPPPPPPPPHKHYAYGSPVPPPPPPPPPHHFNFSSGGSQDSWRPVPPPPPPPPPAHHHAMSPSIGNSRSWFTYEELEAATGGFSRSNLLGEGGFGCVYKGYLPGGQVVAVKQLKVGSGQGEREFRAEVEIISRVHHRHLVSLVGYCIADSQRLLVYDYVPNGTLEHHLHGKGRPVMNWPTRLKIAAGAARGLAYLHEDCHPRIIHRDIKTSNILLDNNFEAQVSDFGLAKLASDTYTHVTTRVMGTFGYLAPEYASTGKLTDKSDVYSFGVVLLELITGRRPVDTTQPVGDESLVEWARPYLAEAVEDGNIQNLVDKRLNDYNENEMLRMVEAAAACVRHSASRRPRMAQVVRALESDSAISDLNQGVKPGHSSNYGSADYDTKQYISDMRKFRKTAFGSQEHGSEYSGPTSEYGINPSASSSEALSSVEMDSRRRAGLRSTETSSSEINVNNNDALNGR